MVNIETIKYMRESLDQAGSTKNEKAWKACECLASTGNDIPLGTMAELFGIERFRVSRTNVIFSGGSSEMVKAYKDGAVPLHVAYKIVRKTPVAQRDKALAEYLAAPKGKHGRRNPKPGGVRGKPSDIIWRCAERIMAHVEVLDRILDANPTLTLTSEQVAPLINVQRVVRATLKRAAAANVEANV